MMSLICTLHKGSFSKAVIDDTPADQTTILIVEDEEDLADMYGAYLDGDFDVEVVYSGESAIDTLDERIDIVLLDRRMPVVSGNEVLAYLEEKGLDCRVAMVTAVNPDFDIIDLRIDDYLVKPVSRDDVLKTVDRMLKLEQYNDRMQELTSRKLKRNVLELEKTKAELAESDEFDQLNQEIETLESEVEKISESLDTENLQP